MFESASQWKETKSLEYDARREGTATSLRIEWPEAGGKLIGIILLKEQVKTQNHGENGI